MVCIRRSCGPLPIDALMIGVMPGTFNPPTFAHLEMARRAVEHANLERVDWVVSTISLGKETLERPTLRERVEVLEQVALEHPWLGVATSDHQLVADIAGGYDALIVGADKWAQINDVVWYTDGTARDEALRRLPAIVLVAPRAGALDTRHCENTSRTSHTGDSGQNDGERDTAAGGYERLDISGHFSAMSSTLARTTASHLMLPIAAASGLWPSPS